MGATGAHRFKCHHCCNGNDDKEEVLLQRDIKRTIYFQDLSEIKVPMMTRDCVGIPTNKEECDGKNAQRQALNPLEYTHLEKDLEPERAYDGKYKHRHITPAAHGSLFQTL